MEYFKSPTFTSRVSSLLKQHHTPGLAVAALHNDELAASGHGVTSINSSEPCTADTLFDIASCSKSFTAVAVALLVEDNEHFPDIKWDAKMCDLLLDDFVMPGSKHDGVSLDDVFGHRSGMPGHDDTYRSPRAEHPDDARSVTRNLRNLPVAAPVRSKYMYCNMMYTVATHLLEVKTGQSFSDFLHEQLFAPLGMTSTFLQPSDAHDNGQGGRVAAGHAWQKDRKAYSVFQAVESPEDQGAGSILTSVNDLIKWVKALLYLEGPITEGVYKDMTRMRTIVDTEARRLRPFTSSVFYAAGLELYWYRGHLIVGHDGAIPGFGSKFFWMPEQDFGMCVVGNSGDAGAVCGVLMREMIDEVLKVPKEERRYRKNLLPYRLPERLAHRAKLTKEKQKDSEDGKEAEKGDVSSTQSSSGEDSSEESNTDQTASVAAAALSLTGYTGTYHNPGYHTFHVQIKDDKLFIDATDRSMGFTLTFDHISDGTKFIAHLSDWQEEGDAKLDTEFVLDERKVVNMGIKFEYHLEEKIWFERIG